jgi:hypothetical protein
MVETLPALERVVVPRAAGEVLVEVIVAVGEDVESGTLLVGDDGGVRVEELLAEADVEEGRVQRSAPQTLVVPARAGPRPGDGRRKHQIVGRREHRACALLVWSDGRSMLDGRSRYGSVRCVPGPPARLSGAVW